MFSVLRTFFRPCTKKQSYEQYIHYQKEQKTTQKEVLIDNLRKSPQFNETVTKEFQKWLNEAQKNPEKVIDEKIGLLADFEFEYDKEIPLSQIYLEKGPPPKNPSKDSILKDKDYVVS